MSRLLITILFSLMVLSAAAPQKVYLPKVRVAPSVPAGCRIATATPINPGWIVTTPPVCSYDAYDCSDFDTYEEAETVRYICAAQCMGNIHNLESDENQLFCANLPHATAPVQP
jgi:hypothetical protein